MKNDIISQCNSDVKHFVTLLPQIQSLL